MSLSYAEAQSLFSQSLPFSPLLPTSSLPSLAALALALAFVLSFYFSTLRPAKSLPLEEVGVAAAASVLGGVGVVAAFCAVGVNV